MTITEYGYTSRQAHDQSKAGLDQVLDKLAATFATNSRSLSAGGETRTLKPLRVADFESAAYTISPLRRETAVAVSKGGLLARGLAVHQRHAPSSSGRPPPAAGASTMRSNAVVQLASSLASGWCRRPPAMVPWPPAAPSLSMISRISVPARLSRGVGAQRQERPGAEAAAAQDELGLVEAQQQVGHLGHQVGIRQLAQVGGHHVAPHPRRAQRPVQRGEVLARHLGVRDARQRSCGRPAAPGTGTRPARRRSPRGPGRGSRSAARRTGRWPCANRWARAGRAGTRARWCEVAPSSERTSHQVAACALLRAAGGGRSTMSTLRSAGSELLPVPGWLSTMAMRSKRASTSSSIGVSGMRSTSTIARFSARPTIPPSASVTSASTSCSTSRFRPLAAARASGSGLSCM